MQPFFCTFWNPFKNFVCMRLQHSNANLEVTLNKNLSPSIQIYDGYSCNQLFC